MSGRHVDACILEQLWRTNRASSRHVGSKLDLLMGCSLPQFLALRAIATSDCTMVPTDVAVVMGCSKANVGPIAKRLQEMGWITKSANPWDARVVSLRPTPTGQRNYEMLAEEVEHAACALFGPLDEGDKDILLALLRQITGVDLE